MPQVKIRSISGPAVINYTISTPTTTNAQSIDPTLPTVLFLHPVYIGQVIFQPQFANPNVRRFNLVAMDFRCFGETQGAVPLEYTGVQAADDVFKFMEALHLPSCHLVGLSMGGSIAIQLAIDHPDKVLSLFLISPLPMVELEDVIAGRQEIYDFWVEGNKDQDNLDEAAILDAVFGALEFGFNRDPASIVNALVQYTLPRIMKSWSPAHFEEFHTASVKFFMNGQPHPTSELEKINCPIHLIHCGGDIAYPLECLEDLQKSLEEAGLEVRLSQIPDAAHFGSVTHPEATNKLFHDWMMDHACGVIPSAKASVLSPFEAELIKYGYSKDDSQSDSEDEFMAI